jgi:DNA-binding HxlR family transcriptional regulator
MTATQSVPKGDQKVVLRSDCPSRPILDQIADKWSMMVMKVLE